MFKTETKRIGVHTYKVTQLDAVTGRRAFTRLFKLVGPAITQLNGKGEDSLSAAFSSLVERLEPEDVDYFCDTFSPVTEVSGGSYSKSAPQLDTVFSVHFAGDYMAMMQWLVFCFRVNFSSFFDGAGQAIGQLAGSGSNSPST